MEIWIAIITSCGASLVALLSTIIQLNSAKKKKSSETAELIQSGVRELLFYRIKHNAERCIKDGFITLNGYQDLHRMYKIYHDMGGNGYITGLMEDIEGLPKK